MAADAYMPVSLPAVGALDLSKFGQLHDALLAQGLATAEEIDGHRAAVDRGIGWASPPLISAWGRKPSEYLHCRVLQKRAGGGKKEPRGRVSWPIAAIGRILSPRSVAEFDGD